MVTAGRRVSSTYEGMLLNHRYFLPFTSADRPNLSFINAVFMMNKLRQSHHHILRIKDVFTGSIKEGIAALLPVIKGILCCGFQ